MRFQKLSVVILSAIAMVVTGVAQGAAPKAGDRQLKVVQTIDVAKISDVNMKGSWKIANGSVIANTASLTKLWKLWKLDPTAQPKIDFHKHIAYLYTKDTGDGNRERYMFQLTPQGFIDVRVESTNRADPLTRIQQVKLMLLDRAGVTHTEHWAKNAKGREVRSLKKILVEPKKK